MTLAEALHHFHAGRLHPHCPACGENRLFINGRKRVRNNAGQIAQFVIYVCARCTAPFMAWIDPDEQEKEGSAAAAKAAAAYESTQSAHVAPEGGPGTVC